jgi:hypothetical protein
LASAASLNAFASESKLQGPPFFDDLEFALSGPEEQRPRAGAGGVLVGDVDHVRPEPLCVDDMDRRVGHDAADEGAACQILEACQSRSPGSCGGIIRVACDNSLDTACGVAIRLEAL